MKKIIVIGGGISGLCAGCFGQMEGYDTEIYEMQRTPGGLCTSWTRKGYLIDGCIEWMVGINPDNILYDMWNRLGVFDKYEFLHHDYVMQIEGKNGQILKLYSDADMLQNHLLQIAPEDSAVIKELADEVRNTSFYNKKHKMIFVEKYAKMTMYEFLQQFKNEFLKEALGLCLLPLMPKEYTVGGLIFRLSFYNRKDAGWPVGGSLAFAKKLEDKYVSEGGNIYYDSKVSEIITRDETAVGIRLSDGSERYADYVISAIDGHELLFCLLKENSKIDSIKSLFQKDFKFPASMQVSLGINCDLSSEPYAITIKLDKPLKAGDTVNNYLYIKHYCYDPVISEGGKTVITSIIKTDYEYWEKLHDDAVKYREEKGRICSEFIKIIEKRFPEAVGKIEIADAATPMTYARYTGTWKGSYMGWWGRSKETVPVTLSCVNKLYIAGQWTRPSGGIAAAMISGSECIKRICIDDKKTDINDQK